MMALRRCLLVLLALMAVAAPSTAQPAARRVLILYSFDFGLSVDVAFARALRTELSRQSPEPITFFDVSMQPISSAEAIQEDAVANYLRASLGGLRLDLVVTVSGPAALFARRYRERLFPDTPVLLAAVDERLVRPETLTANETAVPLLFDPVRIVEDVLRVRPQTTNLFIVLGNSPIEKFWRKELSRDLQPLADRLQLSWSNQLSVAETMTRASALPANSAILYTLFSVDANGFAQIEDRVIAELHQVANAPLFGLYSTQLGMGVVGGRVISVERLASATAATAVRLLRGESARTITTPPLAADRSMYDWRELQRWAISETLLPTGSIVEFRQQSVWDQYGAYIVGAVALLGLQSALIAGLVVQRIRRRRTELALRESEQRFRESAEQNQDLAGRLISAQEAERTRIARDLHDDLGQQLAGWSIMLSDLKRKIGRPGVQPDLDRTVTTLQDRVSSLAEAIRNLSHVLHPSVLQHAGLAAVLRRHCADLEAQHHVTVTCSASENLDSLSPEVALCLFRVAQEALTNAVRHARARAIHVRLMSTDGSVELRVVDDGIGFITGERAGRGLGLRSIEERVRFTHGQVTIESWPDQGTTLSVRIPLAAPAELAT